MCDILAGFVLYRILQDKKISNINLYLISLLFNPFLFVISSRGSCDGITTLLFYLLFYLISKEQLTLSGFVYGLLIHIRIYPIIFAPMIVFHFCYILNKDIIRNEAGMIQKIFIYIKSAFNIRILSFIIVTLLLNIILLLLFYRLYGYTFIYETYLYHTSRVDIRHNYSLFFYSIYLTYQQYEGKIISLFSFVPIVLLIFSTSINLHQNIHIGIFILSFIFVTFNKVVTSQYFTWYLSLLPLVSTDIYLPEWTVTLPIAWILGNLNWLFWANMLENNGKNVFMEVFISSVLFYSINCTIIGVIIFYYNESSQKKEK